MPIQTQFPTGFFKANLVYQLRDTLADNLIASQVDGSVATLGPGIRNVFADSGGNLSIEDGNLLIAARVDDLDPAMYWTKSDGLGFLRENGLALVAYHRNGTWVGWSNSTTLSTSALLYGAKGRDAYSKGISWTDALTNSGDDVHILVFGVSEVQHFVRRGPLEYLAFTYPLEPDETFFPAVLGKIAQLESLYVYRTTPALPLANIAVPAADVEFTHPQNEYLIEFDVINRSGSLTTSIILHQQDALNYLRLDIAPNGQVSLYRFEGGVSSLVSRMSDVGDVIAGSRIVVQMRPNSIFGTSNGSGTTFKGWVDGKLRASTGTAPFQTSTAGKFSAIAAGIPISNFKIWSMTP